eukprot:8091512-Pyramimonas_sp.AAC.1
MYKGMLCSGITGGSWRGEGLAPGQGLRVRGEAAGSTVRAASYRLVRAAILIHGEGCTLHNMYDMIGNPDALQCTLPGEVSRCRAHIYSPPGECLQVTVA